MNIDLGDLGSLILSFVTLIGLIITLRRLPAEIKKQTAETTTIQAEAEEKEASTAQIYEGMAARLGARIDEMDKKIVTLTTDLASANSKICEQEGEIKVLQTDNTRLRTQVSTLQKRIKCLEDENGGLKSWAAALVEQVMRLGGTPVEPTQG